MASPTPSRARSLRDRRAVHKGQARPTLLDQTHAVEPELHPGFTTGFSQTQPERGSRNHDRACRPGRPRDKARKAKPPLTLPFLRRQSDVEASLGERAIA